MVEAVSYKSPHAVLEMLRKKKEETAFDKLRRKSTAKRRWISLDIELQKDIKTIKWYATKNGFYLGTDAYYMVKFRIRMFVELPKIHRRFDSFSPTKQWDENV